MEKARQAEEAKKRAEAEAAKLAEQQARAKAIAEKARQIAKAVQNAAAALKRAEAAENQVSTSLNSLEENQGFTTIEPFNTWQEQSSNHTSTAKAALNATANAQDTTTAFNKAEEANTAAIQAEQIAKEVVSFVNRFTSAFTFKISLRKSSQISSSTLIPTVKEGFSESAQCGALLEPLNQPVFSSKVTSGKECRFVSKTSSGVPSGEQNVYTCSCQYTISSIVFYEKK